MKRAFIFALLAAAAAFGEPTPVRIADQPVQVTGTFTSSGQGNTPGPTVSLTGNSSCATVWLAGQSGAGLVLSSGTLTTTLTPSISGDAAQSSNGCTGGNWTPTAFIDAATGNTSSTMALTNPNAGALPSIRVATAVCARVCTAASGTSGSASAFLLATAASAVLAPSADVTDRSGRLLGVATVGAGTATIGAVKITDGAGNFQPTGDTSGRGIHTTIDNSSVAVTGTFFQVTQPISASSLPLPTGAAQDSTLSGGTAKAIARGGAKGASTAADVTSTAEGTDHQALDVQLWLSGSALDPRTRSWALSSGTDSVAAILSAGSNTIGAVTAPGAAALALDATLTSGSQKAQIYDGTNTIGTSAHPVRTDPTGSTTQPITGTVTSNAGTGTFASSSAAQDPAFLAPASTSAPAKAAVVMGKTADGTPQYVPIPLAAGGSSVVVSGTLSSAGAADAVSSGAPTTFNANSVCTGQLLTAGQQSAGFHLDAGTLGATLTPQCSAFTSGTTNFTNGQFADRLGAKTDTLVVTNPNAQVDLTVVCPGVVRRIQVCTGASSTTGSATGLANAVFMQAAAAAGSGGGSVSVTSLPATPGGTNLIGKVGIDQTTPGTTNGVQVNAALPAGSNVIGKMVIDQTTPGTTNGVQVNAALPSGTNVIGHVINDSGSTTAVTGTVTIAGNKTNNNAAPGATNIGAMPCLANAAAPTWTEGDLVFCSVDLSGNMRTSGGGGGTSSSFGGAFPSTGTAIGASDGTNMQGLQVESSSNKNLKVAIFNGSTEAAVKAGSTLPASSDTAIVVTLRDTPPGVTAVKGSGTAGAPGTDVYTVQPPASGSPSFPISGSLTPADTSGSLVTINAACSTGVSCAAGSTALVQLAGQGGADVTFSSGSSPTMTLVADCAADGGTAWSLTGSPSTSGLVDYIAPGGVRSNTVVSPGNVSYQLVPQAGCVGTTFRVRAVNTGGSVNAQDRATAIAQAPYAGAIGANSYPSQAVALIAQDSSTATTSRAVTASAQGVKMDLTGVAGSAIAQGHGTAATALRVELPNDGTGVVGIATGTNTIGAVSEVPTTSGGLTISRTLSAASANATSVKASAGQIYGWYITNAATTAKFVKFYNKASSPTVGTDTPVMTLLIPSNGTTGAGTNVNFTAGIAFGTGIAMAITGVVTDADTTAVAANDVVVNLFYK